MYIIHSEIKYKIEDLAKHSRYFNTLQSNNFIENNNKYLDLTHRGQSMKDVFDMIFESDFDPYNLSSKRLKEMMPILNEFLFIEHWHLYLDDLIQIKKEEEEKEERIKINKKKEGKICHDCGRINKWFAPERNLDWEEQRTYCNCDYIRDDSGNRMSRFDWLEEYYSSEENCKHGSSLFYT